MSECLFAENPLRFVQRHLIYQCPFGKISPSIPSILESNIKCFLMLMFLSHFLPLLAQKRSTARYFLLLLLSPFLYPCGIFFLIPVSTLFPCLNTSPFPVCAQYSSIGLCLCSSPCYCKSDTSCLHSLQQNCTSINKVAPLAAWHIIGMIPMNSRKYS